MMEILRKLFEANPRESDKRFKCYMFRLWMRDNN